MKRILITIFCLIIAGSAFADKVYLKGGEVAEGKIISNDGNIIKLQENDGLIRQFFKFQYTSYEEDAETIMSNTIESLPTSDQISATKRELINKILELTNMKRNIENNIQQILERVPLDKRQQLQKLFVADEILNLIAPVYAKYYDEKELSELVNFYQSPLGKKVLESTPQITRDIMQVTIKHFEDKVH